MTCEFVHPKNLKKFILPTLMDDGGIIRFWDFDTGPPDGSLKRSSGVISKYHRLRSRSAEPKSQVNYFFFIHFFLFVCI